MWQGIQTDFVDENSQPCSGSIALAVGDRAVCYAAADGQLRCAGGIYDTSFGSSFVPAGMADVRQILISPTFNSVTGNGACVVTTQDAAYCMGDYNDWGQFGHNNGPSSSWVNWGIADVHRIATGTWDRICAMTTAGVMYCAGEGQGPSPVVQDGGTSHAALWLDTFGANHFDDPTVYRACNGRTACVTTAQGAVFREPSDQLPPQGAPGQVVDTVMNDSIGNNGETVRSCWLDAQGRVWCVEFHVMEDDFNPPPVPVQRFTGKPVLMVAGCYYSDTLCVVHADGSIACIGSNHEGELGTGNTNPVTVETEVQPPGSVAVPCQ